MEKQMHQAIPYVKVAAELFLLASVFTIVAFITMFITPYGPRFLLGDFRETHVTSMDILSCLFFAIAPLIFAFLTYVKIVRPLKEGKVPSKFWNLVLAILGYFFGLVIGGILLSMAYHKIHG